jgi:hypothetical protein
MLRISFDPCFCRCWYENIHVADEDFAEENVKTEEVLYILTMLKSSTACEKVVKRLRYLIPSNPGFLGASDAV